ncbi:hypothetical protein GCM10011588_06330 [Nocardia jinanensis]|uniref:Uncharacterized protein n=1 Tax=Nocardia jinanensis TaxID=382504 RepID=A0A917R8F6_9NOCA|nr:hypothetical protein GCM10011588_06330 [Nocardia jinanensis]
MQSDSPKAIGLIRKDAHGNGVDIHQVAQRYGYRLVHTVYLDCGPLATALILTGALLEHNATAVIVPSFEHADPVRNMITERAALATPMPAEPVALVRPSARRSRGRYRRVWGCPAVRSPCRILAAPRDLPRRSRRAQRRCPGLCLGCAAQGRHSPGTPAAYRGHPA